MHGAALLCFQLYHLQWTADEFKSGYVDVVNVIHSVHWDYISYSDNQHRHNQCTKQYEFSFLATLANMYRNLYKTDLAHKNE